MSVPNNPRALLLIIGGGNMAQAIIRGAVDARLLAPGEVSVCEPDEGKRRFLGTWGVGVFSGYAQGLASLSSRGLPGDDTQGGQVLLAVKPQALGAVAAELGPLLAEAPRTVISILAGTPIARLRAELGDVPLVRVMPNTPARLRKAMTAIAVDARMSPEQARHASLFAYDLFAMLGEVVRIREDLMDAFTALAGSGPAYLFYLAQAMLSAAQHMGFDRITADRVVRQTLLGSAELLAQSRGDTRALRAAVTSKGGTTAAAVDVLDQSGSLDLIERAILAARDRGQQLA